MEETSIKILSDNKIELNIEIIPPIMGDIGDADDLYHINLLYESGDELKIDPIHNRIDILNESVLRRNIGNLLDLKHYGSSYSNKPTLLLLLYTNTLSSIFKLENEKTLDGVRISFKENSYYVAWQRKQKIKKILE